MSLSQGCQGKTPLVRAERTPGEVAVSGVYRASQGRGNLALEPPQTNSIATEGSLPHGYS